MVVLTPRASERIVGASGLLFVIGALVGFGVLVGSVPGPSAETDEVSEFLARSDVRVLTGGYVGVLAQLAFLVFAAGLWGILRVAEGGNGWVSTLGLAAVVAATATVLAGDVVPGAAAFRSGSTVDPATTALLLEEKKLAEVVTVPLFGLFLASVAIVALRVAALPRWLGWSAAVIASLSIVAVPLGYEPSQIPVFLTVLWIVALSGRLLARPLGSAH